MKKRILSLFLAFSVLVCLLNFGGKSIVNAEDAYTITFDGNGGTLKSMQGEYLPVITSNPARDGKMSWFPYEGENNNKILMGYKVQGGDDKLYVWDKDFYISDEKTPYIYGYDVTDDVTFIAQWKDTHKVTMKFGSKHRSIHSNTEVEYYIGDGMKIGDAWGWPDSSDEYTSVAYIKSGDNNTFYGNGGYDAALQEDVVSLADYVVNEDTTFEVVWANGMTISFDCNGGYINGDVTKTDGSKITQKITKVIGTAYVLEIGDTTVAKKIGFFSDFQLEKIKKDDGSVFKGWKKDGDSHIYTAEEIKNMTFNSSTKFVAQWEKKEDDPSENNKSSYSNEWVDGKWYNADGTQTYEGTLSWKSDATGWWVEDSAGWYPQSQWQKIDGKWYYFCADGYMDYSEYRDGCWLGADGAWDESFSGGHWMQDATGWWYEDGSWYPVNQYLWIDGVQYWFGADGYWS